jgi:hypothetical protein
MSDQEFILLPLVLPDDAPGLALLHYNVFYLPDPETGPKPMSLSEFTEKREPRIIMRLTGESPKNPSPYTAH